MNDERENGQRGPVCFATPQAGNARVVAKPHIDLIAPSSHIAMLLVSKGLAETRNDLKNYNSQRTTEKHLKSHALHGPVRRKRGQMPPEDLEGNGTKRMHSLDSIAPQIINLPSDFPKVILKGSKDD